MPLLYVPIRAESSLVKHWKKIPWHDPAAIAVPATAKSKDCRLRCCRISYTTRQNIRRSDRTGPNSRTQSHFSRPSSRTRSHFSRSYKSTDRSNFRKLSLQLQRGSRRLWLQNIDRQSELRMPGRIPATAQSSQSQRCSLLLPMSPVNLLFLPTGETRTLSVLQIDGFL